MARTPTKATDAPGTAQRILGHVLFGLCLCVLALRVTYTESPTAQTSSLTGAFGDMVYSLTVSGVLIFALALWLVWGICAGRSSYRVTGIEIGLALFLIACVISTAAASDKRLAITQVMILLGPLLAAVLLAQILDSALKVRLLLIVMAAAAIVSAYQSAEQFFTSNQITIEQYENAPETLLEPIGIEPGSLKHFLFEHRLYSRGVRGFFTTSNSAASFALMASFAAIALLLEQICSDSGAKSKPRDWLCRTLAAAMVVAGLLLTQSKGGILSFLAAGVLFAFVLYAGKWLAAHRRFALTVLLPFCLVVMAGAGYAIVSYGLKHGRLPGGNSMLVRWQYWVASAQMCGDHPITGVGPGNFAVNYPRYKPAAAIESVADPHNLPLSLLAQYGPLGLAGFLVMVLLPLWKSVTPRAPDAPFEKPRFRSPKGPTLGVLGVVCLSLLLLRPILIPIPPGGDLALVVYELLVLYVAPVAAFLIGFLLLAAPVIGAFAKQAGTNDRIVTAALGCAVFGVLVHNLIDFAVFEPGVWTAFWSLIACLVAIQGQKEAGAPPTCGGSRASSFIAVAVALAVLGAYWRYVWSPVSTTTTYIQTAQRAAARGRFDRAHRLLNAAAEADPLSPAAVDLDGRLYLQQYAGTLPKQAALLEEAGECFRRATQISPADYKDYEKSGEVYSRLGQYQQAYDWYTQAIERYPGCGRLWFRRGQAADRLGKSDLALADYGRAVEIEDAFRIQFRQMYPDRKEVVSRLGEQHYQFAKQRIAELSP
jgi:O-antigen ligase/Tfp pilus assembly protein PilF